MHGVAGRPLQPVNLDIQKKINKKTAAQRTAVFFIQAGCPHDERDVYLPAQSTHVFDDLIAKR